MNIQDYKKKIGEVGFEEYPYLVGSLLSLGEFIDFEEADLKLKIHFTEVILCRCFPPTGGVFDPASSDWFIENFLLNYQRDLIKPWLSSTIRTAIEMVMEKNERATIATTFMFGIVEFYAKYKLGFRPDEFDFFDKSKKNYIKNLASGSKKTPPDLFIGNALESLKKKDLPISLSLRCIDGHNIQRLKDFTIQERRFTKAKISDRLSLARNTMLHGENHSFGAEARYLVMLYILFYYHDVLEQESVGV
jgi:hypothetical protein